MPLRNGSGSRKSLLEVRARNHARVRRGATAVEIKFVTIGAIPVDDDGDRRHEETRAGSVVDIKRRLGEHKGQG